jgi:uncharacterized protein
VAQWQRARGFMQGMHMRHDGWARLFNDEGHVGCLIPMMMLYHEHDKDPKMRPKAHPPEQRENIKAHMAVGPLRAYRYFRERRQVSPSAYARDLRRIAPKVGRNVPSPCTAPGRNSSGAAGRTGN